LCSLAELNITPTTSHFRPYPSPNETTLSEVNDLLIIGDELYAAVGDAFGLYKWNLETEQLLKTYSNSPYLQIVQTLADTEGASPNLLLTGGEAGVLSLWDCHQDKLVQEISLSNNNNRKGRGDQKWITSLAVLDDNWCTVGGGIHTNSQCQGFLSTLSVPTRSVVAYTETLSRPQRCVFLPNRTLATASNESAISYRHATSLDKTIQKTCCSSPSVHVLAVAPDERIAVGGVGGMIDLLDAQGLEQTFQLVINYQ
jgi:WD40 repeat protein